MKHHGLGRTFIRIVVAVGLGVVPARAATPALSVQSGDDPLVIVGSVDEKATALEGIVTLTATGIGETPAPLSAVGGDLVDAEFPQSASGLRQLAPGLEGRALGRHREQW